MIDREHDFDRKGSAETGSAGSPVNEEKSGNLIDFAQQRGGQAADKAQQTTSDMMEQARKQASLRVSGQKDRVAETLTGVAHAVRETGTQLRAQDQVGIAEYAEKAAQQIDRFSGYFSENDLESMVHQVETFARRQPLAFVGGSFLLGFLGARFLRSSAPPSQSGPGYGPKYGYEVPRSRVPARQGYPDSPEVRFRNAGAQIPGIYSARGASTPVETPADVGRMPGIGTNSDTDLSTPSEKAEGKNAAA